MEGTKKRKEELLSQEGGERRIRMSREWEEERGRQKGKWWEGERKRKGEMEDDKDNAQCYLCCSSIIII